MPRSSVPTYSFVTIEDVYTSCYDNPSKCLPITSLLDISFQMITDFQQNPTPGYNNVLIAVPCDGCDLTAPELEDIIFNDSQPYLRAINIGAYEDDFLWNFITVLGTLTGEITQYNVGDCFGFCIYQILVNETGPNDYIETFDCIGRTNCFRLTNDFCYTTKIRYVNNEDTFGFIAGFPNVIRLPMYISRPQYPGEQAGYQRSDGTFKKLSERINKTYELKTDWMPEIWHERLRVALSCDSVNLTNANVEVNNISFYRDEPYEIEWNETVDYPFAKGKTKIYKTLLELSVNSNCV